MSIHRKNEILELLHTEWKKDSSQNLIQFIIKLSQEAGYKGPIEELDDDVLIYHLKMRNLDKNEMIPGLAKDRDEVRAALAKTNSSL